MDLHLYQPNVEFLATFDEVYTTNLNELNLIEKDITRLEFEMGTADPRGEGVRSFGTTGFTSQEPISYKEYHTQAQPIPMPSRIPRRKSDGDLLKAPTDRPSVRQRINEWILEGLKSSAIERAQHRAIFNDPGLGGLTSWALVQDFWKDESSKSTSASPPNGSRNSGTAMSVRPMVDDILKYPSNMGAHEGEPFINFPPKPVIQDMPPSPWSDPKQERLSRSFYETSASC